MATFSKRLAQFGLLAVITLVCVEVASCPASKILAQRSILYVPLDPGNLSTYLTDRDPELGWPSPKAIGKGEFDAVGSRVVPAFPDTTAPSCASIYGDSFAWGEEVDAEHAWGNVLSHDLGCRVANFGVPGYGPDQAYLRYARNTNDRSKVVILTHLSENVMRNLNRLRNLLAPTNGAALKPRFLLDATGELKLLPIYTPKDEADLRRVLDHPEVLDDEWFAPGGPAGVAARRFPYSLSIVRGFTSYKTADTLKGRPPHMSFYEPTHPAHGLQISVGIAKAFVREAQHRDATPLFLILPLVPDFSFERKNGTWPYAPLVEALEREHVPFLDMGPVFEADLKGGDPCSLYVRCGGGHFNEHGSQMLAEHVQSWVTTHRAQ